MFYAPLLDTISSEPDSTFAVPLSERHHSGPNKSFIPGTSLQWCYDSVSLKLLQGCLRKYDYKLLQGWQWSDLPPALAWGRDFHTCAETYHKCRAYGLDFETAVRRTARLAALLGERLVSFDTSRTKETLIRSVVWYLDEYKDDPLKTAILPSGKPAVELSFMLPIFDLEVGPTDKLPPLDIADMAEWFIQTHPDANTFAAFSEVTDMLRQGRKLFGKLIDTRISMLGESIPEAWLRSFYTITIHFSGHFDRIVHFGSEVFVTDYKTSKYQLTLDWLNGFDRSTQFLGYFTAATILASQPNSVFPSPPAGVLVDGLQLQVNATRFGRFPLRYSAAAADEFLHNFEMLVRTKAEPAARLGFYPSESESECDHYRRRDGTGGCEFRKVCNSPPAARERELKQAFTKNVWDPSQSR